MQRMRSETRLMKAKRGPVTYQGVRGIASMAILPVMVVYCRRPTQ